MNDSSVSSSSFNSVKSSNPYMLFYVKKAKKNEMVINKVNLENKTEVNNNRLISENLIKANGNNRRVSDILNSVIEKKEEKLNLSSFNLLPC